MQFALPIMLAISAVTAGVETYELVSQPSAPKAPTATQTQTQQAQAAEAAAQAQATALMQRRGMAATVLTSPLGITSTPQTQRATLGA